MKKSFKVEKKTIKLKKSVWVFQDHVTKVNVDFTQKQTENFRKKLGMTVESVDVIIDPNRKKKNQVQVIRMYRNGKRIHRKNPFKGKLVK